MSREGRRGVPLPPAGTLSTPPLLPPRRSPRLPCCHRYVPWVTVNGVPLGSDLDALWHYVCMALHPARRPQACYMPPDAADAQQLPSSGACTRSWLGGVAGARARQLE